MGAPSKFGDRFEPAIAGFFCQKCEEDSNARPEEFPRGYPASLKSVRIICAEKVDSGLIREAFENGADGILICGCLIGKCRTLDGNAEVLGQIHKTHMVLKEMGIIPGRLRQEWICASGGECIRSVVLEFTKQIRAMGPLNFHTQDTFQENA
jgi:heterodisulfide reductase subunit A